MERLSTLTRQLEAEQRRRAFEQFLTLRVGSESLPDAVTKLELVVNDYAVTAPFRRAAVSAMQGSNTADLQLAGLSREWLDAPPGASLLTRLAPYAVTAPINVVVPIETTGMVAAGFVAEGQPAPASAAALTSATLSPYTIRKVTAMSRELVRMGGDARVQAIISGLLRAADTRGVNAALLDDEDAVAFERPRGLLHDVVASGAGSNLGEDLSTLFGAVSNGQPIRPVFITSGAAAIYLASLTDAGRALYPNVSASVATPGSIVGIPQLVAPEAGARMILIDCAGLILSDDGVVIDAAESALLDMDDSPAGSSAVSMLQTNQVAVRTTHFCSWSLGRAGAIGYVELPISGSPS